MKTLIATLAALVVVSAATTEASAVVCARGVYRAGCAGPHGAVVTTRPAVRHCYYRAGVRVCR